MATIARERRQAVQIRSRAKVERILASAAAVLAEVGAERMTMTQIARRSDVVIGTLYQYFADKSAITEALLRGHYADVEAMIRQALEGVESLEALVAAVETLYERYARLHRADPFYRELWAAVQTDAHLQALDNEDTLKNAALTASVAQPFMRDADPDEVIATFVLLTQFALTAARLSLALPEPVARHAVTAFQRMIRDALMALGEA